MRAAPAQSLLRAIAAAGPLPATLVAAGGLSVGFALWLEAAAQGLLPRGIDDAALAVFVLAATVAVFAAWEAYGRYFSQRAGVDRSVAMRWDAWSWALLAVFPLLVVQPALPLSVGRCAAVAIALWSLAKIVTAARFNKTVRDVALTFLVTRASIIVIAELAYVIVGQRAGVHAQVSDNPLLAVWGRWDAVHYIDIAKRGYYGTDMAFFPLYPALIHVVSLFTGNAIVAGILISNVSLFFGLLFCYKLVEHLYDRGVAQRTIFYISIFPTAVFFSAAYTESLFFALTVASFYYIREHKWLLAGLLGGLAALTRVEGVLLAVPFAIEAFNAYRAGRGDARRRPSLSAVLGGGALIPLGLALYMATLWVIRGDPLYFSHVQAHWNRHLAPPWTSVFHAIKTIGTSHAPPVIATQALELGFTALMIAILAAGFRSLPLTLSSYMALSIIIPMCTSSLMSMPRFALVLFPMFIIMAIWGERNNVNSTIVAFSLPLLGLFTVLFANWYWVA